MLIDGIDLQEGSDARNLTVIGGSSDPSLNPNDGELFYRTDLPEFRVRIAGSWEGMATITALLAHTHVLEDLADVILGSPPTLNDILMFDGTDWINSPHPAIAWGTIIGTLSSQTDLQSALDAKVDQSIFNTHVSGSPLVHTAADIVNVPSGSPGITASNVQAALDELNTEKESVFSKNTGFNLALGTAAGTVSEGDHVHTGVYESANVNIQSHISDVTTNPHAVTKALVGLGNVDNTSDINKPISTLTQSALNGKAALSHNHPANVIINTPAGDIAATDVQAAINELDNEKAGIGQVNTFTQNQTLSSSFPRITYNDTTQGVDLKRWRTAVNAGGFELAIENDAGGTLNNKITVTRDAPTLALSSTDITYSGQSIARVATANTFTAAQTIDSLLTLKRDSEVAERVYIRFLDSLDAVKWDINVDTTGDFFLKDESGNKMLDIATAGKTLKTSSTDITYNGQSIARVATANTFTAFQTMNRNGNALELSVNHATTATEPLLLARQLVAKWGLHLNTSDDFSIRNMITTTDVFKAPSGAKTLALTPTDITYDGVSLIPAVPRRKNYILNPKFAIWQRGTSFTSTLNVSPTFNTADKYSVLGNLDGGTGQLTASQQALAFNQTTIPNNPTYVLRVAAAVNYISGNDGWLTVDQRIEGVETLSGSTVTISFWARSSGTRNLGVGFFQYFGSAGTQSATDLSGAAQVTLSTTWQKFTVTTTVSGMGTGARGPNNDDYIALVFRVVSKGLDAAGFGWGAIPDLGTAWVEFSNIQLEEGAEATDFEYRPITEELPLCQRYYQINHMGIEGYASAGASMSYIAIFNTPMRVPPTATESFIGGGGIASLDLATIYTDSVWYRTVKDGATGQAWRISNVLLEAEL